MTILSLIVAMDNRGVIGLAGGLPWHLPADLKYFRDITMGKPIIMGRKTYEAIGWPLPGRRNIIVTRNTGFKAPGCEVVNSIVAAETLADDVEEIMVIGGATVYVDTLSRADRLYITKVHADVEGDASFPEINYDDWWEVSHTTFCADEKNNYDYSFIVYDRIKH